MNKAKRPGPALFEIPRTKAHAVAWLKTCVEFFGCAFHPDTPGDDYANALGDTFTSSEARQYERARRAVFNILPDPYEAAMPYFEKAVKKMLAKREEKA